MSARTKSAGRMLGLLAAFQIDSALARDTVAAAQLLFEQGRDLLRAGNVAEACPKLAESQRLDPATGTLLALAMCHEQEGKLASAWAEFSGVVSLAGRAGHHPREQLAKERVAALKPRLSTLTLRVPAAVAAVPELTLHRDGTTWSRDSWAIPVPVDGGEYELTAAAPGYQSWRQTVVIKPELDAVVVELPALRREPKPAETTSIPLTTGARASNTEADRVLSTTSTDSSEANTGWNAYEWGGIGALSLGVGAAAIGVSWFAKSLKEKTRSNDDCNGTDCGEDGSVHLNNAVKYGNIATVYGVCSGALLLGGAALFWFGGDADTDAEQPNTASWDIDVGPRYAGFRVNMPF